MAALMKAVVVLVLLTLMVLTPSYGDGHARGEPLGLSVEAYPAKCQFKPGETVSIEVVISNAHARRACGELSVSIKRLAEEVHVVRTSIEVQPRASLTREFRWAPPPEVAGYGADVALQVGADLLRASTAFDVVDSWTRAPRYGFLCDFPHEDADVGKVRPGAFVVFNCVNNWPVENIAPSDADIVYIEVWPPHDTYADIVELISEGRRLGSGKAVVLAAYLSPALESSVRYLDAVIFSAGGSHIELGEGENMLADPYFPKYERIPSRLAHALRRYYDFCTRYVELLYLGVTEGAPGVEVSVLDYPSTTQDSAAEEIWLFPKRKENLVIINLVNFLRVKVPLWRSDQQAPPILSDVRLRVRLERPLSEVYFASPEYEDGKMVKLEAIRVGEPREYVYEFVAPHLEYWSTVVIREQAG